MGGIPANVLFTSAGTVFNLFSLGLSVARVRALRGRERRRGTGPEAYPPFDEEEKKISSTSIHSPKGFLLDEFSTC